MTVAQQTDAINKKYAHMDATPANERAQARALAAIQKPTAASIQVGLAQELHMIKAFANAIRKLAKEGLNKTLLDQMIQMGPADGLPFARRLRRPRRRS